MGSGGATVSVLVIAAATAQQPRQDETDGSRRANGNHRTFTDELPGAFGNLVQVLLAQGSGGAGNRIRGLACILSVILAQPLVHRGRCILKEPRSEERRVGKECVSTCRYRWSPFHYKKKTKKKTSNHKDDGSY